jgi:hypothetical protein
MCYGSASQNKETNSTEYTLATSARKPSHLH